jgi:acyl carrier protein
MIEPTRTAIEAKIKEILIQDLQVDSTVLESAEINTPLLGRGIGLDSVEALRLALGLENAFDISIPDKDLTVELFSSIGAVADYVVQKVSALEAVK